MRDFIEKLPKAELHLHIEGTLEPELMFQIAARNGVELPFRSVEQVKRAYAFTDLQSFLDIYYEALQVLLHEQDFYDLGWAYLSRAHRHNVRHVEMFFDAQAHTDRGVYIGSVMRGLHRALQDAERQFGITNKLILCFLRHLSPHDAMHALDEALEFRELFHGVGLDSSERDHPPDAFETVFARAREEGFFTVAHAGEEGPPDYIWQALDLLRVSRIDHGVRCEEDARLLARLKRDQTPLTMCPLSNVKLRVFDTMREHNIQRLLRHGVCVTINSDDPAYFGGYINDNYFAVQETFALTADEIKTLARNSIRASFLSESRRSELIRSIDIL